MLYERDAELGLLHQLVADLGSTGGRVVLVRGEAGIGKTALVDEFVARVSADAEVLHGACDDLLTPQPLAPVWDMARAHDLINHFATAFFLAELKDNVAASNALAPNP